MVESVVGVEQMDCSCEKNFKVSRGIVSAGYPLIKMMRETRMSQLKLIFDIVMNIELKEQLLYDGFFFKKFLFNKGQNDFISKLSLITNL